MRRDQQELQGRLSASQLQSAARRWGRAPRRWGHPLHSICSYMAMFPPAVPNTFIRWLTDREDVVYDPFSGRGTTALEACLLGRRGFASDLNPLALVLSGAKVDPPRRASVEQRLRELGDAMAPSLREVRREPEHIRVLFHKQTLAELLWLRTELNAGRRVDRFLLAALLGILHLNAGRDGLPRGLTVAMPNTFAMSPAYLGRYIKKHRLKPRAVDVVGALEKRIRQLEFPGAGFRRGTVWRQDAVDARISESGRLAKLIFTSPPYLEVMLYGKLNWIRLWLLGYNRREVDADLFSTSSLERYLGFAEKYVRFCRGRLRDDGYMCIVLGDVQRRDGPALVNLARAVRQRVIPGTDLKVFGTVTDRIPSGTKVSRIWKDNHGRATKTDRILLLGGPKARVPDYVPQLEW